MSQMSFSDFEYAGKRKQTRRERFLAEMEQVVPWSGLIALIEPHYPKAGGGSKPYPLETILRIHLLHNWFSLSDPAMEEALYEITSMRRFARLTLSAPIPEDTTIMNFRHLLEKHQLAAGILETINAYLRDKGLSLRQGTIIHAPSSTKNKEGKRDPEMHQTKKGNQYFFGISDLADRCATQHLQAFEQTQCAVQGQAQDREGQSPGTCEGRASVSGDRASVRLCEDFGKPVNLNYPEEF